MIDGKRLRLRRRRVPSPASSSSIPLESLPEEHVVSFDGGGTGSRAVAAADDRFERLVRRRVFLLSWLLCVEFGGSRLPWLLCVGCSLFRPSASCLAVFCCAWL